MLPFNPARRRAARLLLGASALAATPALALATPSQQAPEPDAPPSGPPERLRYAAADQAAATVPGFPGVRFFGDSSEEFLRAVQGTSGAWLSLSSGGEDGAYGAGVLTGMSAAGTRPEFSLVSGVSTGALMAPYVFLGSRYDSALARNYTSVHAGDIFELVSTPESLFDTWPMKKLVERSITDAMIAAIADEHGKGRRLFVITTNLDAGRPVVWDMGAIAARGGRQARELFRDVLLASSSIPGFFPPVHITVEANGKRFTEMHADGAILRPFYVAPEALLAGASPMRLPASELYVLMNNKLTAEFSLTERSVPGVLARSISVAMKGALRGEIIRIAAAARSQRIGLRLSMVPPDFSFPAQGAFDPRYMQALFDLGVRHARSGSAFGGDAYAGTGVLLDG